MCSLMLSGWINKTDVIIFPGCCLCTDMIVLWRRLTPAVCTGREHRGHGGASLF